MYRPVLVAPPAAAPVSLDEAKAQLDYPDSDRDALITSLIDAAVAQLDGWTGILGFCIEEQTWRQNFDAFERVLRLPLGPLISIASVKYDDTDGVEQTVEAANFVGSTDDLGSLVRFSDAYPLPAVSSDGPSVRVEYVAGHATEQDDIKQAIMLMVRHWFDEPSGGRSTDGIDSTLKSIIGKRRLISL